MGKGEPGTGSGVWNECCKAVTRQGIQNDRQMKRKGALSVETHACKRNTFSNFPKLFLFFPLSAILNSQAGYAGHSFSDWFPVPHSSVSNIRKSPDGEWPITYTCFSLKWNQGLRPFAAHTYPKFTEVIPPLPDLKVTKIRKT